MSSKIATRSPTSVPRTSSQPVYTGSQFPNFYCGQFTRDTNHDITVVHDNYINIANVENKAVGLKIDYRKKFHSGRFEIFSDSAWQINNKEVIGDQIVDYTGSVGSPVFTNQTSVNFSTTNWDFHWGFDLMGKASDLRYYDYSATQPATANYPHGYDIKAVTPFYQIHNLAIKRRFDKYSVSVGINNVFDKEAPTLSSGEFRIGNAALNSYDLLGRSVYFTIDKRF